MDTTTLTQRLSKLNDQGYTTNFSIRNEELFNLDNNTKINIEDFQVNQFYRFEGMTNPSDSSILYAIQTKDGAKGTLVEGYGISSTISKKIAQKIKE